MFNYHASTWLISFYLVSQSCGDICRDTDVFIDPWLACHKLCYKLLLLLLCKISSIGLKLIRLEIPKNLWWLQSSSASLPSCLPLAKKRLPAVKMEMHHTDVRKDNFNPLKCELVCSWMPFGIRIRLHHPSFGMKFLSERALSDPNPPTDVFAWSIFIVIRLLFRWCVSM